MRELRTIVAAVAGLVGLLAAFGPARLPGADEPTLLLASGNNHHGYQPRVQFTIEGTSVRGLYPGAVKEIKLRITNPDSFTLRIHSSSGRVISTSRRNCPAIRANVRVQDYTGRLPATVQARSRAQRSTASSRSRCPDRRQRNVRTPASRFCCPGPA